VRQTRSRTRALRYAPAKPTQPVLRINQSALAPRTIRSESLLCHCSVWEWRTVSDYPSAHTVQTPSLRCSPTLHGAQSTALESGSDTPPMHICSHCLDMQRLRFCRHRFARIHERKRTHAHTHRRACAHFSTRRHTCTARNTRAHAQAGVVQCASQWEGGHLGRRPHIVPRALRAVAGRVARLRSHGCGYY
jgi:hypothetical protein